MHSCRSPRKAGWLSMPHPGGPQTPRGGRWAGDGFSYLQENKGACSTQSRDDERGKEAARVISVPAQLKQL